LPCRIPVPPRMILDDGYAAAKKFDQLVHHSRLARAGRAYGTDQPADKSGFG
jgi:hypothetical protein